MAPSPIMRVRASCVLTRLAFHGEIVDCENRTGGGEEKNNVGSSD